MLLDPTGRQGATGIRPNPEEEAARLLALQRYAILDTPEEAAFDRISALARDLYDVPIALVSLVDATRQWFKSRIGIEVRETPRAWSICDYAIATPFGAAFVVPDTLADPRFATNPLVTGEPHLRFYAGAPMITPDGHALGTVSVMAPAPRPAGLTEREQERLRMLAEIAMDELELRLQIRLKAQAIAETEAARRREARLRRAQEAAGVVAFEFGPGGAAEASDALRALYGLPPGGQANGFQDVLAMVHPEDRAWLAPERNRLVAEGGPFEHEYRVIRPDGTVRWLQARGAVLEPADRPGAPPRRTVGVVFDVTARRLAEERQALLTREMDHRARNALALVQAAVRLTPVDDPADYARAVEGRVAALARAQTLLARSGWSGTELRTLAEAELAPFLGMPTAEGAAGAAPPEAAGTGTETGAEATGPRATLDGPALVIAPYAVQPLSMVLHELATNAAKYGALSAPGGRVALRWRVVPRAARARPQGGRDGSGGKAGRGRSDEPMLHLTWAESGGPRLAGPPARRGFGSRVLEALLRDQLSGQLRKYWLPRGLRVVIALPAQRVLAGG